MTRLEKERKDYPKFYSDITDEEIMECLCPEGFGFKDCPYPNGDNEDCIAHWNEEADKK